MRCQTRCLNWSALAPHAHAEKCIHRPYYKTLCPLRNCLKEALSYDLENVKLLELEILV